MKLPLFLKPEFKDYLWGGEKLKTDFAKQTPMSPLAESWELCAHKDGNSVILNGEYSGQTLADFILQNPKCIGKAKGTLPVMVKLIDAADKLSVQVHPDDEYAMRVEGERGKTEMWYVVDCEPDAELIFGFKNEVTREEFKNAILNNTLLDIVNRVRVKKGDVFFIKATTLHAIGKGIIIAEIQQNSNTTYRIYDYARKDAQGNERELHIEKALEVTCLSPSTQGINPKGICTRYGESERRVLSKCEYFTVEKLSVRGEIPLEIKPDSFVHLLCVEGKAVLSFNGEYEVKKGDSVFIPAQALITKLKGNAEIILTSL